MENQTNNLNKTQAETVGFGTNNNFSKDGIFYIFGEIDDTIPPNIIAPLIQEIDKRAEKKEPTPIKMYITSNGGYVNYAFDIISLFEVAAKKGIQIHTYVSSHAISAASLIAVCGHKRFGASRAYHLLHYARGADYAHNPVMIQRNAENFKFLQDEIVKIYHQQTKITNINEKLLADNYMINGGKNLLKYGIIDELI